MQLAKAVLPRSSVVPATSSLSGAGFYDEPWDLSTVTRSIQEQLCESSRVGSAAADNWRPATTDVYAQPRRREKHQHRLASEYRRLRGDMIEGNAKLLQYYMQTKTKFLDNIVVPVMSSVDSLPISMVFS